MVDLTIKKLNLFRMPFSRQGSYICLLSNRQKDETGTERDVVYFSFSHGLAAGVTRWDLIKIEPLYKGEILPYSYHATPSLLVLRSVMGKIEICFDGYDTVLFRSEKGLGVHFSLNYRPHEQFMDRLDGTVYAHYKGVGDFLFENPHGSMKHNGRWIGPAMTPAPNYVDYLPAADGRAEGYIHFASSGAGRPEKINPFDECVARNAADFEEWCKSYPFDAPEKYADARLLSSYILWINYATTPLGIIRGKIMYMMRSGFLVRAMGWHTGYQAIAAYHDLDLAVDLLYSNFVYQDEYGQIPDGVNDIFCDMHCTKPPIQGFAFDYLVNHGCLDKLTKEHCQKLYEPFRKWIGWWRNFRDIDGNGLCDYVHADESGWDDSSLFNMGMPVESPDIAAFLILLMEAASKLAGKLGKTEEAEKWMSESKTMLDLMIKTFWNGEKFIARKAVSHEVIDTETIAVYQPVILGKRLPGEIIDKIAARLDNEETFLSLSEGGLHSESKKSPFYTIGTAFMMGRVLAPVQLMLCIGLFNAGRKELAKKIAAAYCDWVLENGILVFNRDAIGAGDPAAIVPPVNPGEDWASWAASMFIALSRLLSET
jgi:hypothetical protein